MYEIDFSPENKYLFLIGNGLNIAMGKKKNWQYILDSVHEVWKKREYYSKDCTDILKSPIFSTAKMDAMVLALKEDGNGKNQIKNRASKTLPVLVDKIQDIKFSNKKSTMLDFICNKNLSILTTNFDLNIENYLWQENYIPKAIWNAGSVYMLERHFCVADKAEEGTKVWHIHGSIDKYRTILFSTTRYMRMARKISMLLNEKSEANLERTWLKQFLVNPLIIAGLGLGPEEFLLRWLFIERLHYQRRNKISFLPSYYFYMKKDEKTQAFKEKLSFFKMVNITPVCMGDKIFDNPIWDTNKQVILLPEVEK